MSDMHAKTAAASGGDLAEIADARLQLAERAADEGAYGRVSELWQAAARDGIADAARERWRRVLVEAGDFAAAAQLDGDRVSPLPAEESGTPEASDDLLDFEPGPRESEQPAVAPPLVAGFLRWFGGRSDVYARQWYDARRDRSGYWPVREPLSARVVEQHLVGRLTIGQYVLHADATVSFAALDLDPTAVALEHARLAGGEGGLAALPAMCDYGRRLLAAAEHAGLAAFAEDTGGVGVHLWLFFAPRLAASRARALLRELLWRAGPQPPAVSVEIFPKQDQLSGKGLGNLIKLPLGIHQVTLRPSRLLDRHLQPMDDAEAIAALCSCDPAAIEAVLGSRVIALPGVHPAGAAAEAEVVSAPPLRLPTGPTPRGLAVALASIAPAKAAARAVDRMLAGCAVLRELVRQAHEERRLSADEARALLYTVGLVGRENESIEAMFASAGVSRKELERVRRGLQGPMGCKKLRELLPAAPRCACPEAPAGGYATPALFALRETPRFSRPAPPALPLEIAETDCGASMESRLARIEAALERLERRETVNGERGTGNG